MTDTVNYISAKKKKLSTSEIIEKISVYTFLIIFTLWILVPFSIIIATSVKNWREAASLGFTWLPKGGIKGFDFSGYKEVLSYKASADAVLPTVIRGFLNTLLYVIPPTVVGLFTSSISAYAFAKIKFKHKDLLFSLLIGTMMIPGTIMLTPSYMIYDMIGWTDTPLPLMIPGMFGAAACVFFMRQFFSGIPDSLIEAAKLDGMGYWGIFFSIIAPLAVPALLAQGILGFIGGYNDYFGPYIYLQTPDLYTLQIALRSFSGTYSSKFNVVMAGTVMAIIPTLIIYIFAQKYFIEGIATSGMKL